MAALDFPASPTVGQKYPSPAVTGVPVYTWDGEKWTTLGGAIGSTGASDAIPLIDAGAGAAGSSTLWSRGDHSHPPITTSPTPPAGDNDTSIATTAFVSNAVSTAVGGIPEAPSAVVRYDIAQTLTAPQLIQARQNIYAAPFDAMAYGGLQINGAMEVSQEKGTSGATANGAYACDGWKLLGSGTVAVNAAQTALGVNGFVNCLGITVTTAQASLGAGDFICIVQPIEGWRIARLQWGTANAQPLTIGFWSAHHRIGVYSGSARNAANARAFAFTYTQTAADVLQYNTITILGDTAGVWAIDNTIGLQLAFSMACGSNLTAPSANAWLAGAYIAAPGQINAVAATSDVFRLTGVTVHPGIEAPSAARSPFVMRSYGEELLTCQRYWRFYDNLGLMGYGAAGTNGGISLSYPVLMRATPSIVIAGLGTSYNVGVVNVDSITATSFRFYAAASGAGGWGIFINAKADARL